MIKITGMNIELTRGDFAPFTITFEGDDIPEDGEKVLFSVKRNAADEDSVIMKMLEVNDGRATVEIHNVDTRDLPFGTYEWDIRLPNIYGENEPFTPMESHEFKIVKVIGNV